MSSIDIILPCFNPPHGWQDSLVSAFTQLKKQNPEHSLQIILVNDGSKTGIEKKDIDDLKNKLIAFRYFSLKENKGKGFALRYGVQHSLSDLCIYTDIDFPYTDRSMQLIISALISGDADVVAGIRGPSYYEDVPRFRIFISRLLKKFVKIFLRVTITDTQTGLKGFNKKGKHIFLQTSINRYLFDLEFIFLCCRKKNLIKLMPLEVELKEGVVFTKLSLRILFREGLNFLKLFLRSLSSR